MAALYIRNETAARGAVAQQGRYWQRHMQRAKGRQKRGKVRQKVGEILASTFKNTYYSTLVRKPFNTRTDAIEHLYGCD